METVTEQPIKKIEFFRCPQSLPGVAPLTKKPEDSGYEIGGNKIRCPQSLPGVAPLTKKPEDSGYEIDCIRIYEGVRTMTSDCLASSRAKFAYIEKNVRA